MMNQTEPTAFGTELKRRFDELAAWALANAPAGYALKDADFQNCRSEIERLCDPQSDIGERNAAIPEPSENGPQYVSVNPTPWP